MRFVELFLFLTGTGSYSYLLKKLEFVVVIFIPPPPKKKLSGYVSGRPLPDVLVDWLVGWVVQDGWLIDWWVPAGADAGRVLWPVPGGGR